ncbi:unnamed protein product [Boreogadus saida]
MTPRALRRPGSGKHTPPPPSPEHLAPEAPLGNGGRSQVRNAPKSGQVFSPDHRELGLPPPVRDSPPFSAANGFPLTHHRPQLEPSRPVLSEETEPADRPDPGFEMIPC